jgi:internalin A
MEEYQKTYKSFKDFISDDDMKNFTKEIGLFFPLSINYYGIETFEGIEKFKELDRLNVFGNKITNLEWINQLKNLKHLNCHDNLIDDITGLENLTKLESLYISNNRLNDETIKPIFKLENLKYLTIYNNNIEDYNYIYEELSKLKNLEFAYIKNQHEKWKPTN